MGRDLNVEKHCISRHSSSGFPDARLRIWQVLSS